VNWFQSFWKSLTGAATDPTGIPNFTPRATQVLSLARKEADRLHHRHVGTEHLLLGLIALGKGVAVNVLIGMGFELEMVRAEVQRLVGAAPMPETGDSAGYTPRVKRVLALASREAKALHHTYIGTEHILLGLLAEGDSLGGQALKNLGVDLEATRQAILKELDPNIEPGT